MGYGIYGIHGIYLEKNYRLLSNKTKMSYAKNNCRPYDSQRIYERLCSLSKISPFLLFPTLQTELFC